MHIFGSGFEGSSPKRTFYVLFFCFLFFKCNFTSFSEHYYYSIFVEKVGKATADNNKTSPQIA